MNRRERTRISNRTLHIEIFIWETFPQRWQVVQSQLKFLVLLSTNCFQTYTPQDPRTYSFICHKIWQICHFHSLCNVSQRCLSSQYQKLIFIELCNFSFSSRPQKEPMFKVLTFWLLATEFRYLDTLPLPTLLSESGSISTMTEWTQSKLSEFVDQMLCYLLIYKS